MPIFACMGSVLASDFNAASDGKIPWTMVREHCGRCTTKFILDEKFAKFYFMGLKNLNA